MPKKSILNRGASVLECAIAIVLLLGVSYLVSIQDVMTLNQSSNDARKAAAALFLANEGARVRNSLAPGQKGSYVEQLYPSSTAGGAESAREYLNTPLAGTNLPADWKEWRTEFVADVRRVLVETKPVPEASLRINTYRMEIDVPQIKASGMTTTKMESTFTRSFHDNSIPPAP